MENIPIVILCGGMGTRLAEMTEMRPKPLVEIGGKPILWHIMKHYSRYGFNEFIPALGYKGELIKRYFLDFNELNRDFTINLNNGHLNPISDGSVEPWQVHLVDTGEKTLTGGRMTRLLHVIRRRRFMMTYGDGVSDVDINALLACHEQSGNLVTLTAVRSPARFGTMEFDGDKVTLFREKSSLHEGWINGGFFVIEPAALDYIKGDVMWEQSPLATLAAAGKVGAYRHEGFWQCMDTVRDLQYLQSIWESGNVPWKTW